MSIGRIAAAHGRYPLYFKMVRPFVRVIRTASNIWFPGATRIHTPKGISISSVVFAELTIKISIIVFIGEEICSWPSPWLAEKTQMLFFMQG